MATCARRHKPIRHRRLGNAGDFGLGGARLLAAENEAGDVVELVGWRDEGVYLLHEKLHGFLRGLTL